MPRLKIPTDIPDVYVHARRTGCCTSVIFDFICRPDRQGRSDLVHRLNDLAADRCFAAGRRKDIWSSAGPTIWNVSVPSADAPQVLAALAALAKGDESLMISLLEEWANDPAPTLTERLASKRKLSSSKTAVARW